MRHRCRISVVVAAVVIVGAVAVTVPSAWGATTFYVSKQGSDGNSCEAARNASSISSHKHTINGALACLRPGEGDTLNIGDGVYNESIKVGAIPAGADAGTRTKLVARNPRQAIIQPSSRRLCNWTTSVLHIGGNQSFLLFDGLVFDANDACMIVVRHEGFRPGLASSHITYRNSVFRGATGTYAEAGSGMVTFGYSATGGFEHVSFIGNEFDGSSLQAGNGCLSLDGTNMLADGNYIHDCGLMGIGAYHRSGITNLVIRNNVIKDTAGTGVNLAGYGHRVYNNVFINISGGRRGGGVSGTYNGAAMALTGSNEGSSTSDVAFYNNTAYQLNGSYGCFWVAPGWSISGTKFVNNICSGGTTTVGDGGYNAVVSHNRCDRGCTTDDDPRFASRARGDLRLTEWSPSTIVGAGIDLSHVFTTDHDGVTRGQVMPWSIGAFEPHR
jgi:hypothetical protein